jgi:hypothetical protein
MMKWSLPMRSDRRKCVKNYQAGSLKFEVEGGWRKRVLPVGWTFLFVISLLISSIPVSAAMPDPPSTLAGRQLRVVQVMQIAFDAGFNDEEKLTAVTSVALAESELYTHARNWHPEKGYRPANQLITVKGPSRVWLKGGQMHSDRGLWQIASYWHSYYPDPIVDDPVQAARIAYVLSGSGTDFTAWTSFINGRAQKHFDRPHNGWPAVRPLVRRFLAAQAALKQQSRLSNPAAESVGYGAVPNASAQLQAQRQ